MLCLIETLSICSTIILFIKTAQVDIASRLFSGTVVKMQVPVGIIEVNIGAGKTTLLKMFEQSLSDEDKVKIKVENETIKNFNAFMEMTQYIYQNTFIRIPLTMPLSSIMMC